MPGKEGNRKIENKNGHGNWNRNQNQSNVMGNLYTETPLKTLIHFNSNSIYTKNKKSTCSLAWCPPPDPYDLYTCFIKDLNKSLQHEGKKQQVFQVKQQFCMRIALSVNTFTVRHNYDVKWSNLIRWTAGWQILLCLSELRHEGPLSSATASFPNL